MSVIVNLANLQKKIYLPFDIADESLASIITTIADQCPNVKSIATEEPCLLFYSRILHELSRGYFKSLNYVTPPVEEKAGEIMRYDSLVWEIRPILIHYSLMDGVDSYKILVDNLNQFTALESISIIKHTDYSIWNFDEVLEHCNQAKLENAEYISLLRELINNRHDEVIVWSFICSRPNIYSFRGHFGYYLDSIVKYILHKFPNLKCLSLDNEELNLPVQNLNYLSQKVMMDFFKYAVGITCDINISNIYMKNACDFVASFLDNYSNFKGGLIITFGAFGSIRPEIETRLNEKGPSISIEKNPGHQVQINIRYPIRTGQEEVEQAAIILPQKKLFEIAGGFIHELQLNSSNNYELHSLTGSSAEKYAALIDKVHAFYN